MTPTKASRRRRWWRLGPILPAAVLRLAASKDEEPPGAGAASGPTPTRSPEKEDPTDGRPARRLRVAPGLAVVLIAAVAGWRLTRGDGTKPVPAEPPVVATMATTTTVAADPTKAAQEAYVAFEGAFAAAAAIPDPEFPALRETATGEALADAVEQLRAWQLSGRVARAVGPVTEGVRVIGASLSTDGVLVRACHVNDDQVVVADTGQVVNADVVTRLYNVTIVQEGGRWKVSNLRVVERWEGVAGCAGDRR